MARFLNIFLILLLVFGVRSSMAQEPTQPELEQVEKAFSTGNVGALHAMFSDRVEIAVFARSRLYSRSQARIVLKDLFDEYPPQHFELSTPSETSKGLFAAGTYRYSKDEEPFQVYIRLRKSGDKWTLREILVDKTER